MGVGPSAGSVIGWFNCWRGIPFIVPITALQMHVDDPGTGGLNNLSAVTDRSQVLFDEPDPDTLIMPITGSPPAWDIAGVTGDELISYVSGHDAFTAGLHLFNARVTRPETVTNGDVVKLAGGLTVRYNGPVA